MNIKEWIKDTIEVGKKHWETMKRKRKIEKDLRKFFKEIKKRKKLQKKQELK